MGSLSEELDIVEPIQILERLQKYRGTSDDNLKYLIDFGTHNFEKLRNLQVDLQAKLILTNHPPNLWREDWDDNQLNILHLHDLFFHPENSFHSVVQSWNEARQKILVANDDLWDFLISEFTRFSECLIRLSHRFYVIENEINARNKDILIAYKITKEKYEFTLKCLNNARKENLFLTYIKWTEDKRFGRGFLARKYAKRLRKIMPRIKTCILEGVRRFRHRKYMKNTVIPKICKVQGLYRRWKAKQKLHSKRVECMKNIVALFNPLVRKWWFEQKLMQKTIICDLWEEKFVIKAQALYRGFLGRKRYRAKLNRKLKEQQERERKKKMMLEEQQAEEKKQKMKEEEKARREREQQFREEMEKRQKQKLEDEQKEQERRAAEQEEKRLRRLKEEAERKKREQEEAELEAQRIKIRKENAERKLQAIKKRMEYREKNRKEWAKNALKEQLTKWKQNNLQVRKQREAQKEQEIESRREKLKAKRIKMEYLNRPWSTDAIESKEFRDYLITECNENSVDKTFAVLDKYSERLLPHPGHFKQRDFIDLLTIFYPYCLEWRAQRIFLVIDKATGGSESLTPENVLGQHRPSPRAVDAEAARLAAAKKTNILSNTDLNLAILDLANQKPMIKFPSSDAEEVLQSEYNGVLDDQIRDAIGDDDISAVFPMVLWIISQFGTFSKDPPPKFKKIKAKSTVTVGGKQLLFPTRGKAKLEEIQKKTLASEANQQVPQIVPKTGEDLGQDGDENVEDQKPQGEEGSPQNGPGTDGNQPQDTALMASSPRSTLSSTESDSDGATVYSFSRSSSRSSREGVLTQAFRKNDTKIANFGTGRRAGFASMKDFVLRCAQFLIEEHRLEIELRLSNPHRTRRRILSVYLRAPRHTHLRILFFCGNVLGLPRDVFFESSKDTLGEKHFIENYNDRTLVGSYGENDEDENDDVDGVVENIGQRQGSKQASSDIKSGYSSDTGAKSINDNDGEEMSNTDSNQRVGTKNAKRELRVGFLLLQDLASNPDIIQTYEYIKDPTKFVVEWTLQMNYRYLQQFYPRGFGIKSPYFKIKNFGPFWLEWYPNGNHVCTKKGASSIVLNTPKIKDSVCLVQFWTPEIDDADSRCKEFNRPKILTAEKEYRFDSAGNTSCMIAEFARADECVIPESSNVMLGILYKRIPAKNNRERLRNISAPIDIVSRVFGRN